jgi:hypothetical protein
VTACQLQGAAERIKQEKRPKLIPPALGSKRKVYAGITVTNIELLRIIKYCIGQGMALQHE